MTRLIRPASSPVSAIVCSTSGTARSFSSAGHRFDDGCFDPGVDCMTSNFPRFGVVCLAFGGVGLLDSEALASEEGVWDVVAVDGNTQLDWAVTFYVAAPPAPPVLG